MVLKNMKIQIFSNKLRRAIFKFPLNYWSNYDQKQESKESKSWIENFMSCALKQAKNDVVT